MSRFFNHNADTRSASSLEPRGAIFVWPENEPTGAEPAKIIRSLSRGKFLKNML